MEINQLKEIFDAQIDDAADQLKDEISAYFINFSSGEEEKEVVITLVAEYLQGLAEVILTQKESLLSENTIKH